MYHINPHSVIDDRIVIAMVGLPARGKSYISKTIVRYLSFIGCPVQLFNAGNKRRDQGKAGADAAFFDPNNKDAKALKEAMAMETLDDLLAWLQSVNGGLGGGCACGIFDATNTTVARRKKVVERCAREQPPVKLLFVESLCDDEELLMHNYKMKLANDDYRNADDKAAALEDFLDRVRQYEKVYQPISDAEGQELALARGQAVGADAGAGAPEEEGTGGDEQGRALSPKRQERLERMRAVAAPGSDLEVFRYLQIINAGRKLVAANCNGFLFGKLLSLLHSIHLGPRTIWLVLVGQTANDTAGVLGGDSQLSQPGVRYARAVATVIAERELSESFLVDGAPPPPALVLTGTLRRYTQHAEFLARESVDKRCASELCRASTAGRLSLSHEERRAAEAAGKRVVLKLQRLNELCAGKLDSLSYEQMRESFPEEYRARQADKLAYRYPGVGGESYADLIMRLQESVLMLEQQRGNSIIVCDRAVARVLLGYFQGTEPAQLPFLDVFPGVIELRRTHSGFVASNLPVKAGLATTAAGPGTQGTAQYNNA